MPIYEYTCGSCKAKFEQLVRTMSGDAKFKCPECGSAKTTRTMSVFAAVGATSSKGGADNDGAPMCGRCGGAPGSCQM